MADQTYAYACCCSYPHATVVKYVAHSPDLMLEDIGTLSYFSGIIDGQKRAVCFITKHHYSLGLFRQFAKQELLKTGVCPTLAPVCNLDIQNAQAWPCSTADVHAAAETRFYGTHTVAECISKLKAPLMQTVVSQEWANWVSKGAAKVKDEAAIVKAFLLNEKDFWTKLEIMTAVFQPFVDLLRLTDSLVPAASKVNIPLAKPCFLKWLMLSTLYCLWLLDCRTAVSSSFLPKVVLLHVFARRAHPEERAAAAAEGHCEGHRKEGSMTTVTFTLRASAWIQYFGICHE